MSGEAKSTLLSEDLINAATGVLGSMLIDEAAVGPMLMAVEERDFPTPEYRRVYSAIRSRYGAGKPVDKLLIAEDLGPAYRPFLAELIERTPTAANADAYAAALKQSSRRWQLQSIGEELAQSAQAADDDKCRELLDRGTLLYCERNGIRRVTMDRAFREFFQRRDGTGKVNRLCWGFPDLDDYLHVEPGDMVVIGGYSSAGKTAFALQVAFAIARGRRVGFFSYETSADKLADRTIACQTQTSFSRIMANKLDVEDYGRIKDMGAHLGGASLELLETSGMTVSGIGACAMAYHYDVIVVDYLQKIPVAKAGRAMNDFERVSQVSSDLQQLGRTTGKVIIALSQLSRPEKRKDGTIPPPTMSSLRQSGQIEQDADVVLLLYKEYQDFAYSRRVLDIAKNKDGVAGLGLLLDFDGDHQRFKKSVRQPLPQKESEPPAQQNLFRPIPSSGPTPFDEEAPSS